MLTPIQIRGVGLTCHLPRSVNGKTTAACSAREGSEIGHHTVAPQKGVAVLVCSLSTTYYLPRSVDASSKAATSAQGSEIGHHAVTPQKGVLASIEATGLTHHLLRRTVDANE